MQTMTLIDIHQIYSEMFSFHFATLVDAENDSQPTSHHGV